MFTGIAEETGKVLSAPAGKLVIAAERTLPGIKKGGSISVNGACLTVTDFDNHSFAVTVMRETLRRTNLGLLRARDRVNLERPLALGGELGGHLVQGHVDATGRIALITREGEAILITIDAPPEVMRYTVVKGFIAVDGISLTITAKDPGSFWVSIVDFTRQNTTLGEKRTGDIVNLEADIIAKYVEQSRQVQDSSITAAFLQEHGFLVN